MNVLIPTDKPNEFILMHPDFLHQEMNRERGKGTDVKLERDEVETHFECGCIYFDECAYPPICSNEYWSHLCDQHQCSRENCDEIIAVNVPHTCSECQKRFCKVHLQKPVGVCPSKCLDCD